MLVTDQPENLPSSNDLDKLDLPTQGALIEAAWVRFNGTSAVALEDPPEPGEGRVYIVKATCVKTETALRKDNEERHTVTMEIDSCYEHGKVPIVDENQGALFDAEEDDQ